MADEPVTTPADAVAAPAAPKGPSKDVATAIGIVLALIGVVMGFTMDGGQIAALIKIPALLIVIVGTCGATMASTSLSLFKQAPKLTLMAFSPPPEPSLDELVDQLLELNRVAKRDGLLNLQNRVKELDDRFLVKGFQLIADGTKSDVLREILEADIEATRARHKERIDIFLAAGGFAPTLGILGTVLSLISVLSHLNDPASLGPSIATAFIATLYGVGSANIVFLPISNKLKALDEGEARKREMFIEALCGIQQGLQTLQLEERLHAFLPPPPAKPRDPEDPFSQESAEG